MQKRGQITIVVIIGILILFAFAFVYFLREGYINEYTGLGDTSKRLDSILDAFKNDVVQKCVNEKTTEALELVGKNGGYLNSYDSVQFYGDTFTILCKPVDGNKDKCARSILDINDLQQRISKDLDERISNCISLQGYVGRDYEFKTGTLKTNVTIYPKNVLIKVNYPVSIIKDKINFSVSDFKFNVGIPLGDMTFVVNDVLNDEADKGYFGAYLYSLNHLNYDIRKFMQEPYKFYTIKDTNSRYLFRFAVENYENA